MRARLVRIGNSRGVRLPKPMIREAGLIDEIDVRVRNGAVILTPAFHARSGWAEAARRLRELGGDRLLDDATPTRFDEKEWRWD